MEGTDFYAHSNYNKETGMIRREDGFTLVELLITMVIFVLVIASSSVVFTGLLTQFKQQSKIAETNIEGIVGLEILRQDVERAGYGLPWNILIQPSTAGDWATLANYNEAASGNPAAFNDGSPASASPAPSAKRAPRAIVSGDNAGWTLNNSDYLVVKSVSIARNFAAGKWQLLHIGAGSNMKTWWAEPNEDVDKNDRGDLYPNVRVIVISPGATFTNSRSLVVSASGSYFSPADNYGTLAGFQPTASDAENRIMYGVDPDTDLRVPFNRADYYVRQPGTMPGRCATPGTGILYKATMNHSNGNFTEMPLLDCVADMQVNYWLDTDGDGIVNWPPSDDITALTADQIRDQLKEIRVYVVAHEGQRDTGYDFSQGGARIRLSVLEVADTDSRTIDFADLSVAVGNPEYKFYRWKLYTITVKPDNLR